MNKVKGKSRPAVSPAKQKFQLIVLAALVATAVIIAVAQAKSGKADQTATQKSESVANPAGFKVQAADDRVDTPVMDVLIDQPITWQVSLRRDLFAWSKLNTQVAIAKQTTQLDPKIIHAKANATLKLQGVMYDRTPRALINGQLLTRGGTVAGFEVKEIGKRSVIVTREGVDVRINL